MDKILRRILPTNLLYAIQEQTYMMEKSVRFRSFGIVRTYSRVNLPLKFIYDRIRCERIDGCGGVFQIKNLENAIVYRVHLAEGGCVCVHHSLTRFSASVAPCLRLNVNPLPVSHAADFHFGVLLHLGKHLFWLFVVK